MKYRIVGVIALLLFMNKGLKATGNDNQELAASYSPYRLLPNLSSMRDWFPNIVQVFSFTSEKNQNAIHDESPIVNEYNPSTTATKRTEIPVDEKDSLLLVNRTPEHTTDSFYTDSESFQIIDDPFREVIWTPFDVLTESKAEDLYKSLVKLFIIEPISRTQQDEIIHNLVYVTLYHQSTPSELRESYWRLAKANKGKQTIELLKDFFHPLTLSPYDALSAFFRKLSQKKETDAANWLIIENVYAFCSGQWPGIHRIDRNDSRSIFQNLEVAQSKLQKANEMAGAAKEQLSRVYKLYLYHHSDEANEG